MALDLARAVPDAFDTRVAPEAFYGELAHQPHAPENLHRLVGDTRQGLGRIEFGHRRIGVGHAALVAFPGGLQGQQLGGFQFSGHVGQFEPGSLEAPDRLAELPARGGPLGRHFQHAAAAAHAGRGHGQPRGAQPFAHQLEAPAFLAETVAHRHPAIAKKQFALVVTAVRYTLRTTAHGKARAVHIHQQSGDLFLRAIPGLLHAGRGEQHTVVGHVGMADEMFAAVDHVVITITHRAGLHAAHVGACVGFGHGQAVVALAAYRRQQVLVYLLPHAGTQDVARTRHQHLQAVGRAAQFTLHQGDAEIVQSAAAQGFGHVGRVQSDLDRPGLNPAGQFARNRVQAFHFGLVRVKLVPDEIADRLDDHLLFGAEFEVHGAA